MTRFLNMLSDWFGLASPTEDRSFYSRLLHYLQFAAIMFGFIFALIYPFMSPYPPTDLDIFLAAGSGEDMTGFFYAPWILPYFSMLALLPTPFVYVIANLISALGFLFALRVFKGNSVLFFVSYPFLATIFYGQVDGVYAVGLALMYLSLKKNKAGFASIGWIIGITKFYVGIPLGLGLLWCFARDNHIRLRVIVITIIWAIISLILWPLWPLDLIQRTQTVAPIAEYSIDIWDITGPLILLLWIPVFLAKQKNYGLWVATWTLTVPYLHLHGFTHLLLIPLGALGWLVQIPFLTGFVHSQYLLVIPAFIYVTSLRQAWQRNVLVEQKENSITGQIRLENT